MKLKLNLLKAVLFFFVFFCGLLPRRVCLLLGRGAGRLAFALMRERAQVALDNLKLIYGDSLPEQERLRLAKANFAHIGAMFFEIFHFLLYPPRLVNFLEITGKENLRLALEQGKGVILFSAHMGNFVLMAPLLAFLAGVKFLFRDPSDPAVSELYRWMRQRSNIDTIPDNPRHRCAYLCNRQLKAGNVLGILIDQVETGGIYVDFMGQPAGSTVGAARLAQICGSPLVPIHCVRMEDSRLKVIIEPEFVIPREGPPEEQLPKIVASMNRVVEGWVREHPEQWFWAHRRWRAWRK